MNDYTGKCLFGNWYIPDFSKPMGKGSFGTVYELHSYDGMEPTAVKIISLPRDEYDYVQSFSTLGATKKSADEKFYQTKDRILEEIATMYKVSGHTNCASIMAYEVVDHEDCL